MISESEDFLDSEMTPTLACGCCRQYWVFSMFPFSGGRKRGEEEGCYQEGSQEGVEEGSSQEGC